MENIKHQKQLNELFDKILTGCEETKEIIKTITDRIQEDERTVPIKSKGVGELEKDKTDKVSSAHPNALIISKLD